jgi:lipopolysaccharide transport system ATP-binding protein
LDRYIYGGKDEKAKETQETDHAAGKMNRWGDKKVTITDVEFLDKFGTPGKRFTSFDPMKVRIHYIAPSRVLDPVFGIALYSDQGHQLYGTNTELKGIKIDKVEGEGYIDLEIERIPMLSGRFSMTLAVHTHEGKPYDWLDKEYSFEVMPRGRDVGVFDLPCRWVT